MDMKISSPDVNQGEVGGEGEGVCLGYVSHGGHDSTVGKAAVQHWHVPSEEKVAWLVSWIEVNAEVEVERKKARIVSVCVLVLQATPFTERGKVWSHCNYQVVAEEHNYRTQRLI